MAGDRVKILVVEDDDDDYILTRSFLTGPGTPRFEMVRAGRLGEAIGSQETDAAAILLDLSLPDSQGISTFTRMHEAAPHVPIILLTGLTDEDFALRAVREGAEDYLVKGQFEGPSLRRAIRYAIERKRTREALRIVAMELRARNLQLADDLHTARDIQMAFLPRSYPRFPPGAPRGASAIDFFHVYRPARIVGGDYLHVLSVSDTQAGLFVCDVMGHGMRSALVTAIVRGALEELRPIADDPGKVLSELNRSLINLLSNPGQLTFVSAIYGVIDAERGCLTLANAGHPLPLILRAGLDVEDLARERWPVGCAMGIHEGVAYESHTLALSPGDVVVAFTDGVVEAANGAGVEYGRDRAARSLSRCAKGALDDMVRALVDDAVQFSGDKELDDDVCVLAAAMRSLIPSASGHMGGAPA